MKRNAQERHWEFREWQNRFRGRDWRSRSEGEGQTCAWNWQNIKVFGVTREGDQREWHAHWEETERVLKLPWHDLKTSWWERTTERINRWETIEFHQCEEWTWLIIKEESIVCKWSQRSPNSDEWNKG